MSRNSRIAVLAGAVVVAVVAFVLANGGSSNRAKHTSGHAYIYVVGAKPKGGVQTLTYNKGEQVVLMPLDEFNSWKETLYLLASPNNAAHLRRSIAEAKSGQAEIKELSAE